LITDDLKVVATTKEQRQKIRAHELLERKEMLAQKLECREKERLGRLCQPFNVPRTYHDSIARHEYRQQQWSQVLETKTKRIIRRQEQEREERGRKLRQKKAELEAAMNEARLQEQARRNALRVQQQMAEIRAYEKAYGKTAHWHREADKINNRMVAMKLQWAKKKQQNVLSQSFPPPSQYRQTSQEYNEKLKTLPKLHIQENEIGKVTIFPRVTREGEREEEKDREPSSELLQGREEMTKEIEDSRPESTVREEMKTAPTHEEDEKREIPPQTGLEPDEPVTKGFPLPPRPESLLPTQQELPVVREPHQQQDLVAEGDQAKQELTKILIDALLSVEGEGGTGYMTLGDFLQVLTSPDLGLQLEENEQTYVASQVDPEASGVVVYREAAALVPELLQLIFSQRAEQSMQNYGYYVEEEWVQMYPISGGVVYLNKLTGRLQSGRPEEYRPFLKDEVFEDSLVDFFETADTDRDGVIDYEDFYNLLASPQVASRVYRGQMEELLGLYQSLTFETGGQMDLALFPAVANPLLLMIYQNAYPDVEEWIELESKKFGAFWLNKTTGEIALQQGEERSEVIGGGPDGSSLVEGEEARKKSRSKKKRKHRKKSAESESAQPPPDSLLTTQTEAQSSNQGGDPYHNESPAQPITHSSTNESSLDELEQRSDSVKPVSSRSRLLVPAVFETIPEEDETALDDSLVAGHGIGDGGEKKIEGERYELGQEVEVREGEEAAEKEIKTQGEKAAHRQREREEQGDKEEGLEHTERKEGENEDKTTPTEERKGTGDNDNCVWRLRPRL
jgi:hypothetical protein